MISIKFFQLKNPIASSRNKFQIYTKISFSPIRFAKIKNFGTGTSLVAQWLGIRLPVLGTGLRALVGEDPTCHGATKPVRHDY